MMYLGKNNSFILSITFLLFARAGYGQTDSLQKQGFFVDGVKVISDYEGWTRIGPDAIPYRYDSIGILCNGDYKYFYENGALKHKGFYKDGRIEGKSCDYYENGQLKNIATMLNGRWVDTSWSYYPNGALQSMCVHLTGGGFGSPRISYYDNAYIEEHEYLDSKGYFRFRYIMDEKGDTTFAEYLIDEENLIYMNYSRYDNGELEEEGKTCYSLETGYKHLGVWKYYNERGELIETRKYPTFEELVSNK